MQTASYIISIRSSDSLMVKDTDSHPANPGSFPTVIHMSPHGSEKGHLVRSLQCSRKRPLQMAARPSLWLRECTTHQHHRHPLYSFSSSAVNRYTLQKQKSSPQWPASHRHGRALISHSDGLQPTVSIHSNPAALTVVGDRPHLYSRLLPFAPVTHFYMESLTKPGMMEGRVAMLAGDSRWLLSHCFNGHFPGETVHCLLKQRMTEVV